MWGHAGRVATRADPSAALGTESDELRWRRRVTGAVTTCWGRKSVILSGSTGKDAGRPCWTLWTARETQSPVCSRPGHPATAAAASVARLRAPLPRAQLLPACTSGVLTELVSKPLPWLPPPSLTPPQRVRSCHFSTRRASPSEPGDGRGGPGWDRGPGAGSSLH